MTPKTTDNPDNRIIEVQDLTVRFGDLAAVDGISFSVRRGEIFGFLGPNGAGKTTTAPARQRPSAPSPPFRG